MNNKFVNFLLSIKGLLLSITAAAIMALTGAFVDVQKLKAASTTQKETLSTISTDMKSMKEDVAIIKGWVQAQ